MKAMKANPATMKAMKANPSKVFRFKCGKCDKWFKHEESRIARSTRDRHKREKHGKSRSLVVAARRLQSKRYMVSNRLSSSAPASKIMITGGKMLVFILCVRGFP